MRRILVLAGIAGALAFSAAAAGLACAACGGPPPLAVAGVLGYGTLLALGSWRGDHPIVRVGLLGAGGFHLGLLATMAMRGSFCTACVGAAVCCGAAVVACLGGDRARWTLAPAILPWTAALAFAMPQPPAPQPDGSDRTRILVYENADCPYCELLRSRVLPEAVRGLDVDVAYRLAEDADFVTRTPTIVLSRGQTVRVLEGVPSPEELRAEVVSLGGAKP